MKRLPHQGQLVILGVDTHADIHVVAAIDGRGRLLDTLEFTATRVGFRAMIRWATAFGVIDRIGVEGTGSFGASLARWLRHEGLVVIEVNRPDRATRRHRGKSDTIDAESAARAVLAGTATTTPKTADGPVESLRVLRLARRSAVKARTQVANQLHALVLTAPASLSEQLRPMKLTELVATASRFRPDTALETPRQTYKFALRRLARRWRVLDTEITEADREIEQLVVAVAPALIAVEGVGALTASALLVSAGDNPDRLRSEAAFAHLCGVAPIPASSGKTVRHRLNRGGDRSANNALWVIALGRMARDPRTQDYVRRRTAEGRSKKEIMRCLKRYIARELYPILTTSTSTCIP
jgi:transposase